MRYFLSYFYGNHSNTFGFGNTEVELVKPIESQEDINTLQNNLLKQMQQTDSSIKYCIIINFYKF